MLLRRLVDALQLQLCAKCRLVGKRVLVARLDLMLIDFRTREYPGQEEILAYLVRVAQEYNLYQHVRFNTSVEDARWDGEAKKWRTHVTVAKGSKDAESNPEYTIVSDFLVSAVGQLNMPAYPDISGIDSFEGKKMHSARW